MSTFVIRSATGPASLEFFERTPEAPGQALERFKVRLELPDLTAVARVYMGSADDHPASFFARMASQWRGWDGPLVWESPEGELILCATQNRAGHVSIRVEVRSGPTEKDWTLYATIQAEAGQLDDLAHQAAMFFEGATLAVS